MSRLLLNFIYYNPVGLTVEALKFARGFVDANPGLEVHLAIASNTPVELVDGCDWITAAYPIELDEFAASPRADAPSLLAVPRCWDWVVDNNLILEEPPAGREEARMLNYMSAAGGHLSITLGRGQLFPLRLPDNLHYRMNAPIRIEVPATARRWARECVEPTPRPLLTVVLGGSGGRSRYPEVATWVTILRALRSAIPGLRIVLTGVTRSENGRTSSPYSRVEIDQVVSHVPGTTATYDVGIWRQLALLQLSDALLSPHTGFAFLALCVGTPWVALSGGNWPEYIFNDVPFYSVLPDNPEYPYKGTLNEDRYTSTIPCMAPAALEAKIPEIVDAIIWVMNRDTAYAAAMERHRSNVATANVRREEIPVAPVL